jgi:hypothetical protein
VGRSPSLYEVLQVDPRAEPEIVEAAYRRLARKYHPDVSASADAERRMKEINAAYQVLRDPARRATYDRELLAQADRQAATAAGSRPEPADERWAAAAPADEGLLACRSHPIAVAVGVCECGAGLCGYCFDRFQPASCAGCLLAWASQRRRELVMPALWFFLVLAGTITLFFGNVETVAQTPTWALALEAALGYLVASYPSGWRVVGPVEEYEDHDDVLIALVAAAVVGPVVAPFRMARIVWDWRQLGRLEALARDEA